MCCVSHTFQDEREENAGVYWRLIGPHKHPPWPGLAWPESTKLLLGTQEDQFTGTAGFKQKQAVNISQAPLILLPNIPHTIIAFMIDF